MTNISRLLPKLTLPMLLLVVSVFIYTSCENDLKDKIFLVTDERMMDDYIVENEEESMTAFLRIVDKANYRGLVHAYGENTFFVPTNGAVEEYLQENNVSSVEQLTKEQCESIVRFHIVREVLLSEDFIDGRLPSATMLGKFITTRTMADGVTVQVNRQAAILQKDILVGNGVLHKVSKVLIPYPLTCGQEIENLSDEYKIFREVMKETGWADSLKLDSTWYTVFLQSDASLATIGITDRATLIDYLRANARLEVTDDASLLWYFAAYHCLKRLCYVADLNNLGASLTAAPNQTITIKRKLDSLLLNEFVTARTIERGIPVDKKSDYTDFTCFNGVLHDLSGYIGPVRRGAQAVYWDVAEQPELVKNSRFRKGAIAISQEEGLAFSEMKPVLHPGQPLMITYAYNGGYAANNQWVNQDALEIVWYRLQSLSFTLPVINEGTYKVWVCYRRAGTDGCRVKGMFSQMGKDDQQMLTIDFEQYFDTNSPAEVLKTSGWKRYVAKERSSTMCSQLLGTVVVESTGRHTLTFNVIARGRTAPMWLDMIHFVPMGDDELWPRFDMKGNNIYPCDKETEAECCSDIYPPQLPCSENNDER